nr:hypothetical protein [Tanacetum cinerariifolium]
LMSRMKIDDQKKENGWGIVVYQRPPAFLEQTPKFKPLKGAMGGIEGRSPPSVTDNSTKLATGQHPLICMYIP